MKYIITNEQCYNFSDFIRQEIKGSQCEELKNLEWWKGYNTACKRMEENFHA